MRLATRAAVRRGPDCRGRCRNRPAWTARGRPAKEPRRLPPLTGAGARSLVPAYGQTPLRFEPNRGQTDPQVKFLTRGQGYNLSLTAADAVLVLQKALPGAGAADDAPLPKPGAGLNGPSN